KIFHWLDRDKDLKVVNDLELRKEGGINVIDCTLSPADLGEALVLAARSAGIGASEPFWLQQMAKVFGAIDSLHRLVTPDSAPTLKELMDYAVGSTHGRKSSEENLDLLIAKARPLLADRDEVEANPALNDHLAELENLERYASRVPGRGDPKQRQVV